MKTIGLTGGIGSGKSTVAALFAQLGAAVVDADALAKEAVAPGSPGLQEIAARFPGVVQNGVLDRALLADRIFSNPQDREALNEIIHPKVRQAFEARRAALAAQNADVLIYDIPLLYETRSESLFDGVIVVTAPRETARARLMARMKLTLEQAEARIASQLPLEEKVRRATWVIDNGGTLAETEMHVRRTWESLRSGV